MSASYERSKSTGASLNRHRSNQNYRTPDDFMAAVRARFGVIQFDLAASPENTQAPQFYCEEENSHQQAWHLLRGLLWLNPPFNNIAPWAAKCEFEAAMGAHILFLVPASVGSNWFANYVHNKAYVLFLNPRLCFDGKNPYPKDLILAVYNGMPGYDVWRWK